jgi:hypothetical protein
MFNLMELAAANGPRIEEAFTGALQTAPHPDRIREFATWVDNSCHITINVRLFVVADLLAGGKYLNEFERAALDSAFFRLPEEELLRKALGTFYGRRLAFSAAFEDGRKFYYGALTAGNGGLAKYDAYCLQLKDDFIGKAASLAYLPGDSLKVCFSAGDGFEARAALLVTPHSHRHIMATTKYCTRLPPNAADWPALLTTGSDYIEAIFVADVRLGAIAKIQILKAEYDRMLKLTLAMIDRKLDEAERHLIYFFRTIIRAQRNNVIQVEVVQ